MGVSELKGPNVGSMNGALLLAVWKRAKETAHREEALGGISIYNLFFSMEHQEISKRMQKRKIPSSGKYFQIL